MISKKMPTSYGLASQFMMLETIDIKTEAITAIQKLFISNPPTKNEVRYKSKPLMIKINNPNVNKVNGRVIIIINGRNMALKIPNISAAKIKDNTFVTSIPGNKLATNKTDREVTNNLDIKRFIIS